MTSETEWNGESPLLACLPGRQKRGRRFYDTGIGVRVRVSVMFSVEDGIWEKGEKETHLRRTEKSNAINGENASVSLRGSPQIHLFVSWQIKISFVICMNQNASH